MTSQSEIAIVGAGIGGLATAACLAQQGHLVRVFDRFDRPAPVGSGLVIQPVGQKILHNLGVGSRAEAFGKKLFRMAGHEVRTGRKILDVTYDAPGEPRFGLGIHRASLFDCLLQAAQSAGVEITPGHRVSRVDGRHLWIKDKMLGPFDVIIDASGAGSCLSPLRAKPLGFGALWATVDWPDQTDVQSDELRQSYQSARHMVGVLPIGKLPDQPKEKAAIFWSLPVNAYQGWRAEPIEVWRKQARQLWPAFAPFADQITSHDQMTMARYFHGTLMRPYTQDLILIGDAAHRASPQLGQGANMALLDAWLLSQALEKHEMDMAKAAPCYARARRWHVLTYQMMSRAFTPMYQSHSRSLPVLRDHILAPIATRPLMRKMLTRLVCGDLLPPGI